MAAKRMAVIGWSAFAVVLLALLAATYVMLAQANAAPVRPTWQQSVVTIDDAATVAAAQQWGAPFEIRYAADGADVTVVRADLSTAGRAGGAIAGDAEPVVDGDRIVGCAMRFDPKLEDDALRAHEFGHCLGIGHLYTETSRSVMVKGGVEDREHGSDVVTTVDRAALADLYEGSN